MATPPSGRPRDLSAPGGAGRAATVVLAALAVGLACAVGRGDETPVEQTTDPLRLSYRIEPTGAAAAEQTARVMGARLAAAGIRDADVAVSSSDSLTITAPAAAGADVAALVQRGRVAIYDWERSVLGPRRTPAPTNVGMTKAQANAHAAGLSGARVVRNGVDEPDRWLVLGGEPVMTDADFESAGAGPNAMTRAPVVTIELTARGRVASGRLARSFIRRARARSAAGASDVQAGLHIAVVIDDQIVATPFVDFDFRPSPDAVNGSTRAQIQDGLTPQTARWIAAILTTGPLPAALSKPTGPAPPTRYP